MPAEKLAHVLSLYHRIGCLMDTSPLVDEDSPPHPVNFYGITKVACERELSSMDGLNYAIARLAGVYGLNYSNPKLLYTDNGLGFNLGNYVTNRIRQGLMASIWMGPKVNDIAHPTLASDSAELLMRLANSDEKGIFHCFGSEAISRLEFSYHLADLFGVDHSLIMPVPTDPEVLDAHRHIGIPFRIRASVAKTSALLGRVPFSVMEGLEAYKKEWDTFHA